MTLSLYLTVAGRSPQRHATLPVHQIIHFNTHYYSVLQTTTTHYKVLQSTTPVVFRTTLCYKELLQYIVYNKVAPAIYQNFTTCHEKWHCNITKCCACHQKWDSNVAKLLRLARAMILMVDPATTYDKCDVSDVWWKMWMMWLMSLDWTVIWLSRYLTELLRDWTVTELFLYCSFTVTWLSCCFTVALLNCYLTELLLNCYLTELLLCWILWILNFRNSEVSH